MLARDMWMTPAKQRLLRRTVSGGPWAPPEGTEEFGNLSVPAPNKLRGTAGGAGTAFAQNALVAFIADPSTGTPEARKAVQSLRATVDDVSGAPDVVFGTAPTDLTGIDFTGLVLRVVPV